MRRLWIAALAATSLLLVLAGSAFAAPPGPSKSDNLSSPLQAQQQALIQKGMSLKASGGVDSNARVAQVGRGRAPRYVKLAQTGHSDVFVILAQFGNTITPVTGGTPGPAMGQIPVPDRHIDNTTIWFQGGYTPAHYQQLYFDHTAGANSLTNFYDSESSGRFNFDGAVTNWTTVANNEARYGTDLCGSTVCSTVWDLLRDASAQWVLDQEAGGKSMADIKAYLATFDKEDRYDYNNNGNFDEPDGYIDHFQLIHAGEGEEVGGGAQGDDAIWSHRWYSYQQYIGTRGPGTDLHGGFEIGASVGQPTGFWVGDYVMEPENAGVGVIAHETGHDYGLPDEYDTSGAGEAPSTWWTIMSQGSYGNDGTNGLGNRPVDFDGFDKLQLGWLNYTLVDPFQPGLRKTDVKLGPAEYNTRDSQAAIVKLPQKAVNTVVGTPTEGTHAAYSGTGDNFDSTATRSLAVPAAGGTLSFDAWYDTEQDWDYAFVEVSTDGGTSWDDILTSASDPAANDQSGFNSDGTGISGTSGLGRLTDWYSNTTPPSWVPVTADLSAYHGQTVQFRFEYVTDGGSHGQGFEVDNLKLGTFSDGFETTPSPWTFDSGFHITTGTDTDYFDNYYVVENRQYLNYDTGLKTSPYNFFDPARPNWVEKYPFQDGVLISYWDTSQGDNNTGVHPGSGQILPIDVHQNVIKKDDGTPARNRIQAYDATLSQDRTDSFVLHNSATGGSYRVDSQRGVTTFDDRGTYWNATIPDEGVVLPALGTLIELTDLDRGVARVTISAARTGPTRPPRHHEHDNDHGHRHHR